jgi:peptidoglycan/LPS O-acetylase OafA/YrhL
MSLASKSGIQLKILSYQPEVDGLRSIAVLSVLIFHAFPSILPGGFIGVDIFFVISGYLISQIIFKSVASGGFSIGNFYGRRVRRIFPSLLIVLVFTIIAGWFILMPADFKRLGQHIVAGAYFLSNFSLLGESGYFDASADTKILIHLWSLSIEEQFYVFWPILILIFHNLKLGCGRLILLVGISSFVYGSWLIYTDAVAAFLHPLSRAWEFLVGASVAYLITIRRMVISSVTAQILGLIGSILIAAALILIDKNSSFPGATALIPTIGAAFVILAGMRSVVNRSILCSRIMVGVGLISYPLYLWHWPLFTFAQIIEGDKPSVVVRIGILVISALSAYLTYRFCEVKFRNGGALKYKTIGLCVAMLASGFVGAYIMRSEGLPHRESIQEYIDIDQKLTVATKWEYAENSNCLDRYPSKYRKEGWWFCVLSKDSNPTVMLMGNSFANHLYPGIVKNPAFANQVVLQFGTCYPTMGVEFSAYTKGHPCHGKGGLMQEELINSIVATTPSLKVVLLSAPWPFFNGEGDAVSYSSPDKVDGSFSINSDTVLTSYAAFMEGVERRIIFLISHGVTPVIVLSTPQLGHPPKTCYTSQPFRSTENDCVVQRKNEDQIQERFRIGVSEIQARHSKVKVFDPLSALCSSKECDLKGENGPLLRDQGHLSIAGSEIVGEAFVSWSKINLPELNLQ